MLQFYLLLAAYCIARKHSTFHIPILGKRRSQKSKFKTRMCYFPLYPIIIVYTFCSTVADGSLTINSTVLLNDGTSIPLFGLGVYRSQPGEETEDAVRWALQYGYRHVDTASRYRLE